MPFVREDDRLLLHMARANRHRPSIDPDTPALAIVAGPQAHVSPSWYASKREHGRVAPTWNYSTVHLAGTVTIHDDTERRSSASSSGSSGSRPEVRFASARSPE